MKSSPWEEAVHIIARACCTGYVILLFMTGCFVTEEAYRKKEIEAKGLREELVSLQKESRSLKEREEALRKRLAKVEVKKDFLKKDKETLETEKAVFMAKKAKLERKLALLQEGTKGEVEKAKETISALEDQKKAFEHRIKVLTASKETLEKKLLSLERENLSLRTLIESEKYFKEQRLKEVSSTYDSLIKDMEEEIDQGKVIIKELQGKLRVQMLNEILFDPGSTTIKEEGIEALRKLGKVLQEVKDREIRIEGHTDSTPIGPNLKRLFTSNWELSVTRATSVARYLQEEVGIDPTLLSATGYGPYRPAASNDTPEGRARNRRIEIILAPRGSPAGSP